MIKNFILNISSVKHISYSISSVLFNALTVFVIASRCSVEDLAVYGVVKAFFSIFEFSHLGTRFGMDLVIPQSDDNDFKKNIRSSVSLFSLLVSLLFLLLFFFENKSVDIFFFLVGLVLINFVSTSRFYYRSSGEILIFIRLSFYLSAILPFVVSVSTLLFNMKGFLYSHFVVGLFLLYICKEFIFFKLNYFKYSLILNLFKKGFVLSVITFVAVSMNTMERIILKNIFNEIDLGYYTFIFTLVSLFYVAPSAINDLYMSKIFNSKKTDLSQIALFKNLKINLFITICTLIIAFLLLDYFINLFFIKYSKIIDLIKIALFSVIPLSILAVLQNYLLGLGKDKIVVLVNVVIFILYFSLVFLLKKMLNIQMLIIVKVIVYFLYLIILSFLVLHSQKLRVSVK